MNPHPSIRFYAFVNLIFVLLSNSVFKSLCIEIFLMSFISVVRGVDSRKFTTRGCSPYSGDLNTILVFSIIQSYIVCVIGLCQNANWMKTPLKLKT